MDVQTPLLRSTNNNDQLDVNTFNTHNGNLNNTSSTIQEIDNAKFVVTSIPGQLDRLPFASWHVLVCAALGVSWILDGLIISVVGLVGTDLQSKKTLNLSTPEVGAVGSLYIGGAVIGSLVFGFLADFYGRKKLFLVTPTVYLSASLVCAFSVNYAMFATCVFVIGLGVGGEYSAMNSAINEFVPARIRGFVDLAINGSYWLGAGLGAASTLIFLNTDIISNQNLGWRIPFVIAAVLGISIILMRLRIPESPRWLCMHGRVEEAVALVAEIEKQVAPHGDVSLLPPATKLTSMPVLTKGQGIGFGGVITKVFVGYKRRCALGLALMSAQAFFYNAIFFTYALTLNKFYDVPVDKIGLYELPFCAGNFLGSVMLGPLFDKIGRKPMITATYTVSALLLLLTGFLFVHNEEPFKLTAVTQTLCWSVIFFVSSAASSAAYLTVAELFPLEIRSLSIAVFYSLGTGVGGLVGPTLFGELIASGSRADVFYGYIIGSSVMLFAAFIELIWGVASEGKSLEELDEEAAASNDKSS